MAVIDASVITSWFNAMDINFERAERWLTGSQAISETWNVPSIILAEVAAALSRATDDPEEAQLAVRRFARLSNVRIFPVAEVHAFRSAEVAANQRIRGCDAVYVALAVELNDQLITFDRQQLERARDTVTVIQPE